MRLTDALLALPRLPVLIIMAAVDFGKLPVIGEMFDGADSSIVKIIIIFVVFSWMTIARLIRGAVLSLKEQEFILSAKTLGMQDSKIIIKEILPNVLSPVIVSVTLCVGHTILFEAALSFLGLGIQPPTPSWGNMMTNALEAMYYLPSLVFLPGTLVLIIVVSFNFLGDGLQDALDAKAIRR
jgi:peptide/nickel transport system permease protein